MEFVEVWKVVMAVTGGTVVVLVLMTFVIGVAAMREVGLYKTLLAALLTVVTLCVFATIFSIFVFPIMGFIYVISPTAFYISVAAMAYTTFFQLLGRV